MIVTKMTDQQSSEHLIGDYFYNKLINTLYTCRPNFIAPITIISNLNKHSVYLIATTLELINITEMEHYVSCSTEL